MALPVKGWPKQIGRGLRKRGGHLLFLYNQAWKPLNIDNQSAKRKRLRYREGLLTTSRDPPLTRAAMTRRQISWIISQPEKRSFPCYDVCVNDADGEGNVIPFMTTETKRTLASTYVELGVSVTISGHRFIALTKETSWIDKCKACGRVDAVEFITRCGSQKLCSRQCVQMFVRHRRYRRQIHERPLFIRPMTSTGDERLLEEEIVLEEEANRRVGRSRERETTKRKKPAPGKDKARKETEKKQTKRVYKKSKKSEPKMKLKVKLQIEKAHLPKVGRNCENNTSDKVHTQSEKMPGDLRTSTISNSESSNPNAESLNTNTNHGLLDGNGKEINFFKDESGTNDHGQASSNACKDDPHTKVQMLSKTEGVIQQGSEHTHETPTDEGDNSKLKLGHVKVVLKKCMLDTKV